MKTELTANYIEEQKIYYSNKLKTCDNAEDMEKCWFWLCFLNNLNWIK